MKHMPELYAVPKDKVPTDFEIKIYAVLKDKVPELLIRLTRLRPDT